MGKDMIALVAVALLLQFVSSVLHPSLQTVSRCAMSMLALFCALSIILSAIDKYEPPELDCEQMEQDLYNDTLLRATEEGIRLEVANKFKLDGEKILVTLSGLDTSVMRAEQVYLRIEDFGVDYRSIREFLEDNFLKDGGRAEVELIK